MVGGCGITEREGSSKAFYSASPLQNCFPATDELFWSTGVVSGVCTSGFWIGNILVGEVSPLLINSTLKVSGTLILFALGSFILFLFILFLLPETKVLKCSLGVHRSKVGGGGGGGCIMHLSIACPSTTPPPPPPPPLGDGWGRIGIYHFWLITQGINYHVKCPYPWVGVGWDLTPQMFYFYMNMIMLKN